MAEGAIRLPESTQTGPSGAASARVARSEPAVSGVERPAPPADLSPNQLRTERSIAIIRIAVILVVAAVYLSSIGIRRPLGPLAIAILALAALYALWTLLAKPYESVPGTRFQAATLLADAAFITLWCKATGGPASEFWTLYLIAVIAVAMRFDLLETLAAALALAVLYVGVMSINGGLPRTSLLTRPPLMLITGFAVGVLARERRLDQQQREALARIAEESSAALAEEQALVARLRQVDLAKTEFVAVASHEFRTPLAAILGVVSTLRAHGDELDPDVRAELLDGAAIQAERLARLVEDLLTVSRIEDGALPLDLQPVHPQRLIYEAVQASGTADVVSVKTGGVERVLCDADRIVRVLTNLLDNAQKYSPPGGTIFVAVAEDEETVTFSVRDEGPGVPAAHREEIFERFRRLMDGSQKPGAGLGLYISRCLVEAHGGEISVREGQGGGAEFVFTLPKHPVGRVLVTAEHPRDHASVG
ncbi:MAG TPA: ATP-binding protein [Actinomycetota bacterium]|nr:ATP-binding protein [Actinomycetota bacterium]